MCFFFDAVNTESGFVYLCFFFLSPCFCDDFFLHHQFFSLFCYRRYPDYFVELLFAFQSKNELFLVMEYMHGGDCLSLLSSVKRLPEHVAQHFIAQVLLIVAVFFIHNDKSSLGICMKRAYDCIYKTCFCALFPYFFCKGLLGSATPARTWSYPQRHQTRQRHGTCVLCFAEAVL